MPPNIEKAKQLVRNGVHPSIALRRASESGLDTTGNRTRHEMTRRDWWFGVVVVGFALLAHALIPQYLPRYEWRQQVGVFWLRIDRWTGKAEPIRADPRDGTQFRASR